MLALALLRKFWPVLAVIAVAIALWGWGNSRYSAGVKAERVAWETEAARLRVVAAEAALQRLEAVTEANTAAAASRVALDALALQTRNEADAFYKSNPARNVLCLSPERVRAIQKADAAASKVAAAAK